MVKGYKHMTKEEVKLVKDMHKRMGLGEISRITRRSKSTLSSHIFAKRVVKKPKGRPVQITDKVYERLEKAMWAMQKCSPRVYPLRQRFYRA